MSPPSVDRVHQVRMANSSREPKALTVPDDKVISGGQNQVQILYGNDNATITPAIRSSPAMATRKDTTSRYNGFWGSMTVKTTLIYIGDPHTFRCKVITENTVSVNSTFLKRAVLLSFGASLVSIPRMLRVYRIIDKRDIIWQWCRNGDLKMIQDVLADGVLSPFVMNENGWTLLHVGCFC